jgi:hypothetical protein
MTSFEHDVTTLLVAIAEGQMLLLEQLGEVENENDFHEPVTAHKNEFGQQIKAIHAKLLQHRVDQKQRQTPSDESPLKTW